MFHKRLLPYPTLQAFDRPDLLVSCANRQNTIVAPQALAILNDSAVRQYACDFADRLLTEVQLGNRALVTKNQIPWRQNSKVNRLELSSLRSAT